MIDYNGVPYQASKDKQDFQSDTADKHYYNVPYWADMPSTMSYEILKPS